MELHDNKLRVGFQDLTIKLESPSFAKDNLTDCYGQYLQRENTIQINTGLDLHDKVNTLIHETLHACCYVSGLTQKENPLAEDDKEETVVNNLTNTLHVVFRDNPWLLNYIQEALKKTKTKEK